MPKPRTIQSEGHLPVPFLNQSLGSRVNRCFGCGPANPSGLRLRFQLDAASASATSTVKLTRRFEGPPGHAHGGILATMLDEAMGKVNKIFNRIAVTRHMTLEFLRPAPLGVALTVTGRLASHQGRKMFMEGEIRDASGELLALGRALFIQIDPQSLFGKKRIQRTPKAR